MNLTDIRGAISKKWLGRRVLKTENIPFINYSIIVKIRQIYINIYMFTFIKCMIQQVLDHFLTRKSEILNFKDFFKHKFIRMYAFRN